MEDIGRRLGGDFSRLRGGKEAEGRGLGDAEGGKRRLRWRSGRRGGDQKWKDTKDGRKGGATQEMIDTKWLKKQRPGGVDSGLRSIIMRTEPCAR